jgi:uncharacterized membrane protein YbhN (UPF0104 family)
VGSHAGDIGHALNRTDAGTLVLVTALALVTLIARTEAVVLCLDAMGTRPPRTEIHSANSLTFVAMSVNHYVASPVRTTLLKRIDGERTPTITQMLMVDASTSLIEALIVAVVIIVSAGTLKLPWWTAPAAAVAAIAGIVLALAARARFRALPALRGLEVLAHSRHRLLVAGLMVVVIACQIVRTLIVLQAVGLHPSLLQAAATFVAAGVLSSLFAGPSAGTAGAPIIIFGHRSLSAAAAAGLILSGTALVAALVYAAPGGPLYLHRLRRGGR